MKYLELTFLTPEENLACDEALLDVVEEQGGDILRCWEPQQHFVVVGFANKVSSEVNQTACEALRIPIHRRCSGGGTVVQGPGCLNYSLMLSIEANPALTNVTSTNRYIMERHRDALTTLLGRQVTWDGCTDLTLDGRKFSGNAQRRRRRALLFHGTLLLDFDLSLISQVLPMPSSQPEYRVNRSHAEFVTNLEVDAEPVKASLRCVWQADEGPVEVPLRKIESLVRERYGQAKWNLRT